MCIHNKISWEIKDNFWADTQEVVAQCVFCGGEFFSAGYLAKGETLEDFLARNKLPSEPYPRKPNQEAPFREIIRKRNLLIKNLRKEVGGLALQLNLLAANKLEGEIREGVLKISWELERLARNESPSIKDFGLPQIAEAEDDPK